MARGGSGSGRSEAKKAPMRAPIPDSPAYAKIQEQEARRAEKRGKKFSLSNIDDMDATQTLHPNHPLRKDSPSSSETSL